MVTLNIYICKKNNGITFYVAVAFLWILMLCGGEARGQRVYANAHEEAATIFASVSDIGRSTDVDTSNFTTLNVALGIGGLVTATQNIRFTSGSLPLATSPLMVRFGGSGGLLGLAGSIVLQRTNGGINNTVGTAYTSSSLVSLLTQAGANGSSTEVVLPVPGVAGQANDGVRLQINTALGAGLTARLYYAFFIVAPNVSGQTICSGGSTTLTITNPQPGYTYRWYDSLTGGTQIQGSTSLTYTISGLTAGKTYYVEACEGNASTSYRSGRTPVTVTVNPLPAAPTLAGTAILCSGGSTTVSVVSPDAALAYRWYTTAVGGSSFFTGTAYPTPTLADTTKYYVDAYRTITNCTSNSRTLVQINVKPLPAITFNSTFYTCHRNTAAQLNYTNTINNPVSYSIAWGSAATTAGFANVSNAIFPASPVGITIPGNALPQSWPGTLTLTGSNGCLRNYAFTLVIQPTPHPPPPSTSFQ